MPLRLSLIPRDEHFFDLLEKQAVTAGCAADLLCEIMRDPSAKADLALQVADLELRGAAITREILQRINRKFVTPLDREDIHALALAIDDIIDCIDVAAERTRLYHICQPTESGLKLAQILSAAVEQVRRAVGGLRDLKRSKDIRQACVEINRKENQGDYANRAAVARLLEMTDRPLEALKWKEIYASIEAAIDECEDIAGVIEQVLLKNAR
ncbi:MAG: DUF47 domain-containing protein [Armatimonadota bacterium]